MTNEEKQFAVELKQGTVAVQLSKQRMGIRRTLDESQKQMAAATFDANKAYISAAKKLLDTRHPAFRGVTTILNHANAYWRSMTIPYPMRGIRLLNRTQLDAFETQMHKFVADLQEALGELQSQYDEMREKAREELGDLYNAADYPESIVEEFGIQWDYASVEPPDYLKTLNPDLYQKQCERVMARFDEAVLMAEQMLATELHELVARLMERLAPAEDGKRRVLQDTVVESFNEFFARFRTLNIGSNAQLDETVKLCEKLMNNVDPKELRNSTELRTKVTEGLGMIRETLDTMVTLEPERAFAFDEA